MTNPDLEAIREKIACTACQSGCDSRETPDILYYSCQRALQRADKILLLQTPACRLAVVMKEGKLPENPYPALDRSESWGFIATHPQHSIYKQAQQDMLSEGWGKEVRE